MSKNPVWPDPMEVAMELGEEPPTADEKKDGEERFEIVAQPSMVDRHTAAKFASSLGMRGSLETPQKRSIGPVAIVVRKLGDTTPPVEC